MGLVLIAMAVRVMFGLILKCAFIVGGEVAVAVWALAGWVVADLVAETRKHVLLHPSYFFRLSGPISTSEARTAVGDIGGCAGGSCLSVTGAGFQT